MCGGASSLSNGIQPAEWDQSLSLWHVFLIVECPSLSSTYQSFVCVCGSLLDTVMLIPAPHISTSPNPPLVGGLRFWMYIFHWAGSSWLKSIWHQKYSIAFFSLLPYFLLLQASFFVGIPVPVVWFCLSLYGYVFAVKIHCFSDMEMWVVAMNDCRNKVLNTAWCYLNLGAITHIKHVGGEASKGNAGHTP